MRRSALLLLLCSAYSSAGQAAEPATIAAETVPPERQAAREWFRDAGFGVFIHWGVYSQLGRGEWVMHREKLSVDLYRPLAEQFNPVDYDPVEWVALFKRAGAKYITITSKHHDGFAMWDSGATEWDIVDATPYGKDVLKPLAEECQKQGLKLFFYHSHLDWTHPDYYPRGSTGQHSGRQDSGDFNRYLDFMDAQLAELLGGDYGDVAGIWFDGWWDQRDKKSDDPKKTHVDWRLNETYDLIHRLQPSCLIGNNHHVAVFPGEDFQMFEKDLPGQNKGGHSADSVIGDLPLETCDTINRSWGFRAGDKKYKSPRELIHYLVRAAGQNANLLLNVGPKPDGTIQPEFIERLEAIGRWLEGNGETIYGARGGPVAPQTWGVSTQKDGVVYLHVLDPPEPHDDWTELPGAANLNPAAVTLFGSDEPIEWKLDANYLELRLPAGDGVDTIVEVRQQAE